nr:nucleolin 1-like isoform X2 [Ipomoea batatas]
MLKGYGHVEFTTSEAAAKLLGQEVKLDLAKERGAYTLNSGRFDNSFQRQGRGEGESTTVFVNGFDKNDIEDKISSALEDHFGCSKSFKLTKVSILVWLMHIESSRLGAQRQLPVLSGTGGGGITCYKKYY